MGYGTSQHIPEVCTQLGIKPVTLCRYVGPQSQLREQGEKALAIGIELARKNHKRKFAIPITLQSNPAVIWRHVMAA